MSQTERIHRYLATGKKLNPLQALRMGMGMRLGARICELRENGYKIATLRIKGKPYAFYKLVK